MNRIALKVCGVRSAAEAQTLVDQQVDYVGLNFVPASSRYLTIEQARPIVECLKASPIKIVLLFRDETADLVNYYATQLQADYIQLHGDESADYARQIKTPIMKAVSVQPEQSATETIQSLQNYPADYFVLDRAEQGKGDPVPISFAKLLITAFPDRIFIAGGLGPNNLAGLMAQLQPYGIDIASGVRTPDNQLDPAKVAACLEILRAN